MSSSDSDDAAPALSGAVLERVDAKVANLPTKERLLAEKDPNTYTSEQVSDAAAFVKDLIAAMPADEKDIERHSRLLYKQHRKVFKKSLLLAGYKHLLNSAASYPSVSGAVAPSSGGVVDVEDQVYLQAATQSCTTNFVCPVLERYLVSKAPRSQSGVLVVTVFTSAYPDGQKFSCQWNCYYCPNEPNQPRSYLLNEPGVRRANKLDFDPFRQFEDRVRSLISIGHPADKVELLVLGGTWESYPMDYRTRFIRDLFYAANTIFEDSLGPRRPPLDLQQEQLVNETSRCKIIGVTLETRPDTVTEEMLVELRRFGCTRVQLGVQHTDDAILAKVNRQATREDTIRAIKLLKDSCFKVDIHLMPDLPGATPEIDKAMFDDVLQSPNLQADQWKIYPCQTTPFTVIEEWYRQGLYVPYGLDKLIDVLLYAKRRVHPWIRLNRVIRDIPVDYVLAGVEVANLRQLLAHKLQASGERCQCIRCREVKGDRGVAAKLRGAVLQERTYEGSEGTEVFLSVESPDARTIFGFLRLRVHIRHWDTPFPELRRCALIRELHVYGNLIPTTGSNVHDSSGNKAQHTGIGSRLMARAEEMAVQMGYSHIAVISGVGVRGYYRRKGYALVAVQRGGFLIKSLRPEETTTAQAATAMAIPSPLSAASSPSRVRRRREDVLGALPLAESGEDGASSGWRARQIIPWLRQHVLKHMRSESAEGESPHH